MNKRFLSVLTCLMLLIGLFAPLSAAAAGTDKAEVKVRIVGLPNGQSIEAYVQVGAESFTNTSGDTLKMDKPTVLGALVAALKKTGTAYQIKTVSFGSYVTEVAGLAEKELNANTGWSVWVNNQSPQVGADSAEIKTGDEIVWGYSDWTQTLYPKVELSTLHPEQGKAFTVKVTADKTTYDAEFNATTETVAVEGAGLYDASGAQIAETNKDGVATLEAGKLGLLSFYVDKTDATGVPLLVRSALLDVVVQGAQPSFKDLAKLQWAEKPVQLLAARGIVEGNGAGLYEPARAVTRAELAKMVALADQDVKLGGYANFSDVQAGPYQRYIQTVAAKGYMVGDKEGTFRPNDFVTRAELAVVLVRLSKEELESGAAITLPYEDAKQAGYALPYVMTAWTKGIMNGDADGKFRFGAPANRAEVATAMANMLWKYVL